MFPETLIVCINTHGTIPTDIENNISKPILKKMKYPVNMVKINATTYGVPFISSLDNIEMICWKLKQTVDTLNLNILTPYEASLILKRQCKTLNRENSTNMVKKSKNYLNNDSKYVNLYANYSDYMFNIVETNPNEDYVEKIFYRFDEKKIQELEVINEDFDYFNTIKLVNVDNTDLFELLSTVGFTESHISFTELIDILYHMTNMKNLIVVDMTCSTTEDNNRNDRRIRSELIKQKLY